MNGLALAFMFVTCNLVRLIVNRMVQHQQGRGQHTLCISQGWSARDHLLHGLDNLLRLHNCGSLQLICVCCGHILATESDYLQSRQDMGSGTSLNPCHNFMPVCRQHISCC